jgi:hypothetical protein
MARCLASIAVLVGSCALAASAAPARAGTFSPPFPLPHGHEWHFAVNDRGEGGAVTASNTGPVFYPLSPKGGIGAPTPLLIPETLLMSYPPLEGSVAIDDRGRVAVGLLFKDATEPPSEVEHGGTGCCGRVALASWLLGAPPPVAQLLSPKQSPRSGRRHQVFEAPGVVLGPSATTMLWTREEEPRPFEPPERPSEGEANETQVEEASGADVNRLGLRTLITAPAGVALTHLSLDPSGHPIASWLEWGDRLLSVRGDRTGALDGPIRVRPIPRLTVAEGFANNGQADHVFAYFSDFHNREWSRLMIMSSRDGGRFGAPRRIALIHNAIEATLAGRGRSLVAVWDRSHNFVDEGHLYVARGDVTGRFRPPQALGTGSLPHVFVDSHRTTVIVYRRPVPGAPGEMEIVAVTARPGHRFGAPRRLSPGLREVEGINGAPLGSSPITPSPDGHAAFDITCEAGQRDYLIRYSP